jgi:hypothetical protein
VVDGLGGVIGVFGLGVGVVSNPVLDDEGVCVVTVKQTDRAQIMQFGERGVEIFNEVEGLLRALVDQTAGVHYRGANALEFKTKCANNAVDFANRCTQSMQQMSTAITDATTYIATALGGSPISLDPPMVTVEMPAIDADTSVEAAEDEPLRTLRDDVSTTCDQINTLFEENHSNLQALGQEGWVGPEYDEVLSQVTSLTLVVTDDVTSTKTVITGDISGQLEALGM